MSRSAAVFASCNTCGRLSPESAATIRMARAAAKKYGWTYTGDTDTCDTCRPGAQKQRQVSYWRDVVVHLMRDGFDLNYAQIGLITGLSRQRIHQICSEPIMYTDWIENSRKRFNAEITVPRVEESEEPSDGDDHG